jgi:hypothetical protein
MVRRKIQRADFFVHLGARDLAAIAPGSIVEFCVEISRPAGPDQPVVAVAWWKSGCVAISRRVGSSLAALRESSGDSLRLAGPKFERRDTINANIVMLNEIAFYLAAAMTVVSQSPR